MMTNQKKKSWKLQVGLLIFLLGLAIFVFYQFFANFPSSFPKEDKPIQSQSTEIIAKNTNPKIGNLAPDFASEDVLGNKVALSDFQNKKPVLLIFWATWCGFCAKELPDLKTFTQKYQDRIQVIAVASGEPGETIRDYIEKEDINFLILLDEQRDIWNAYLVRGTPSHFLIGKDGKIITLRPGVSSLRDLEIMLTMLK